jgi:hypothetical protein
MDLFVPALLSRGTGVLMSSLLRNCAAGGTGAAGLEQAALHYAGRAGLIFLVSDFHWPLERLDPILDLLAHAYVVPMIVWDPAETTPPTETGLLSVWNVESRSQRTLWMRPSLRARWVDAIARRRADLTERFARRNIRPFYVGRDFDSEAMSRYFLEAAA